MTASLFFSLFFGTLDCPPPPPPARHPSRVLRAALFSPQKERLLEQEERKLEQEERAKRQAARAAYVEQALLAQQQAHEEAKAAAGVMPDDERQGGQHEVNAEVAASPAAQDRPKRRRAAVDYVALNKELAGHAAVSQPPSDEPKPKVEGSIPPYLLSRPRLSPSEASFLPPVVLTPLQPPPQQSHRVAASFL